MAIFGKSGSMPVATSALPTHQEDPSKNLGLIASYKLKREIAKEKFGSTLRLKKFELSASEEILSTQIENNKKLILADMSAKVIPIYGTIISSLNIAADTCISQLERIKVDSICTHITQRAGAIDDFKELYQQSIISQNELSELIDYQQNSTSSNIARMSKIASQAFDSIEEMALRHTHSITTKANNQ